MINNSVNRLSCMVAVVCLLCPCMASLGHDFGGNASTGQYVQDYAAAYDVYVDLLSTWKEFASNGFVKKVESVRLCHRSDVAFRRMLMCSDFGLRYPNCTIKVDGIDFSILANRIAWVFYSGYGFCSLKDRLANDSTMSAEGIRKMLRQAANEYATTNRVLKAKAKIAALSVEGRRILAGSAKAQPEELELLARDEDERVREFVASNAGTPLRVLSGMSGDLSDMRMATAAKNNMMRARTGRIDGAVDFVDDLTVNLLVSDSNESIMVACNEINRLLSQAQKADVFALCKRFAHDCRIVPYKGADGGEQGESGRIAVGEKMILILDALGR